MRDKPLHRASKNIGADTNKTSLRFSDASAFTLIEVVLVITLIAVITAISVGRVDSVIGYRHKADVRKFVDTWEFLFGEASRRRQAYRLIINLDENSYTVRREVQSATSVEQVDYLANLRIDSQRERLAEQSDDDLLSLEEEFRLEDERQTGSLELMFYEFIFGNASGPVRLARPLEFQGLAEDKKLTEGLEFTMTKTLRGKKDKGTEYIRFSPRGASEFGVVQLKAGEQMFTAFMNPSTGTVSLSSGELDFEWLDS